ncbi:MAG TPA: flippase [Burkholderiales bacterium]|nr:flippase [Burkholderiales bacterium]
MSNIAWLAGDRIFRLLVGLWIGVWVARFLGPQDFGRLAYFVTYISFFMPFAQAGLDRIAVRDLSAAGANAGEILGTAFVVRLVCGLAAAMAAIGCLWLVQRPVDMVELGMVCVLASSLVLVSFDVFDFWFQSRLQMRFSAIARNLGFIAGALVRVVFIICGLSLLWFAFAVAVEAAIAAGALLVFFCWQKPAISRWRFSAERALAFIRESKFVLAYGLVITVQARIDQIMLGNMSGAGELGHYAAALRIVESLTFIPLAIQAVMMPVLANSRASDPLKYEQQLLNLYRWIVVLFLPFALVLPLLSGTIVHLLYGADYSDSAPLLSLLTVRLLLAFIGIAKSTFVTTERLFAVSFVGAAVGALLNVLLNWLLIPAWGAKGAIFASTASFFCTIVLMDLLFVRTRRNFFLVVKALCTPWRVKALHGR